MTDAPPCLLDPTGHPPHKHRNDLVCRISHVTRIHQRLAPPALFLSIGVKLRKVVRGLYFVHKAAGSPGATFNVFSCTYLYSVRVVATPLFGTAPSERIENLTRRRFVLWYEIV